MDELLYMGVNGSILMIAVICFRYFFSQQVSRRLIVFLWICVIVRLLLPVSIPVRRPVPGWMGVLEVSKLWQFCDSGFSDAACLEKTASAGLDKSAETARITRETESGPAAQETGTEAALRETGTVNTVHTADTADMNRSCRSCYRSVSAGVSDHIGSISSMYSIDCSGSFNRAGSIRDTGRTCLAQERAVCHLAAGSGCLSGPHSCNAYAKQQDLSYVAACL